MSTVTPASIEVIGQVLEQARSAAIEYFRLTGKPLGITGELGEYEAARLLGLELAPARQAGFDASDDSGCRYQVKTRRIDAAGASKSQRLGSIRLEHEWDAVLLVILDEWFKPTAIYRAERPAIEQALSRPGSRARNERGALAVSKFKSFGKQVWPPGA